jgi:hypothetical protein
MTSLIALIPVVLRLSEARIGRTRTRRCGATLAWIHKQRLQLPDACTRITYQYPVPMARMRVLKPAPMNTWIRSRAHREATHQSQQQYPELSADRHRQYLPVIRSCDESIGCIVRSFTTTCFVYNLTACQNLGFQQYC